MKCTVNGITWKADGKSIISDIHIEAKRGSFIGILGTNGSGKTTLLKNIYRVLKPHQGTIFIDDHNLVSISNRQSAREMAVVSQEDNAEFDFSVLEVVLMGRYPHKKMFESDTENDKDIARQAIEKVGLQGFDERRFISLSGGEKQRTLIARALTQQAELLILDEPTNHLDIGFKLKIFDIVKQLDLTIIAAIHDLNLAALYCDKIYILNGGRVHATGSPVEVINERLLGDLFGVKADIQVHPFTGKPQVYFTGAV